VAKSRGRKRTKKQTPRKDVHTSKEIVQQAPKWQQEAFKEKFGRDWQAGDPVFFDPDSDVPKP